MGYETHKQLFKRLFAKGWLPPVLMLEGPEGMGKKTFADWVASLSWCETHEACGGCDPCRQIAAHEHEDLLWLDEDSGTLKLKDADLIHEHLSLRAADCGGNTGFRTVVVYDFERFGVQALNRLLKVIEEPPKGTLFVFTTAHKGYLLPTILSRVSLFRLMPPAIEESLRWLTKRFPEVAKERLLELLERHALAPGQVVRYLEHEGEQCQLEEELFKILLEGTWADKLHGIESVVKQTKRPAFDLAQRFEFILNQYYKSKLGLPSSRPVSQGEVDPRVIRQWRFLLRRVKTMSGVEKINLNSQLFLESLAIQ